MHRVIHFNLEVSDSGNRKQFSNILSKFILAHSTRTLKMDISESNENDILVNQLEWVITVPTGSVYRSEGSCIAICILVDV